MDILSGAAPSRPPSLLEPTGAPLSPQRWSPARSWRGLAPWERRTAVVSGCWLLGYALAILLVRDSETGQRVLGDLLYLLPILAASALALLVVVRRRGDRLLWLTLTLALVLWLAGDVAWAAYSIPNAGEVPFPGLPDLFYVGFFAMYVVVAVVAFRGAAALRQFRGLLDAVIIAGSVVHLGWDVFAAPQVADGITGATVLAAAYPLLQIGALVVLLSVGSGYRQVPVSTLLVAGSLALGAVTNLLWTYLLLLERYESGAWVDLGWQAEALLVCWAAVRVLTRTETPPDVRRSSADRTLVPTLVATLATVVVLLRDLQRGEVRWSALALVCVLLLGLTVRLWLTLRDRAVVTEQLDEALRTSQRLAVTDPLTGLYNRRFLQEVLHLEAQRRETRFGVLVIDLDHFKTVNDGYGHAAGDAVLVEVATRLSRALRDGDVLARFGGEEFAVVLPDTEGEDLHELAERCRQALAARPVRLPDGQELTVTASVGGAALPGHADTVDELLAAADRAMYAAKGGGRNRVVVGVRAHGTDVHEPAGLALVSGLERIADLVDARLGPDRHSETVSRWVAVLADALALPSGVRERAVLAARLHDIGMIAVPDAALRSGRPLADAERSAVREHPQLAADVLEGVPGFTQLAPIVRAHHERPDGSGYPDRLKGQQIPVEARLLAVCDAWAAITAGRPHRPARSHEQARAELTLGAGSQFDAEVVRAFLALQDAGLVGREAATAGV